MSSSNKDANLKEKFKQALTSTFKVISEDFEINNNSRKNDRVIPDYKADTRVLLTRSPCK